MYNFAMTACQSIVPSLLDETVLKFCSFPYSKSRELARNWALDENLNQDLDSAFIDSFPIETNT